MNHIFTCLTVGILFLTSACSKNEPEVRPITTLSITLNGAGLTDGADNLPIDAAIEIVFSSEVDPGSFESALSVSSNSGNPTRRLTYSNQSSKVTIDLTLDYQTTYTLTIGDTPIGANGGRLEKSISISFTTMEDGTIYSLPACSTGTQDCLQTTSLSANGTANFNFYASFPIYEEMAEWRDIETAVIVIHGANRNADDYFNYLTTTLRSEKMQDKVVLIAPFFKNAPEAVAGDYYWSGSSWREGRQSANTAGISSFEVVDQLIDQLADENHFPALQKVIVTGQSSGALFTHLYAAANRAEEKHADLTFEYVVSESQYFYYPDGRRIDESTNQLYTPAGCTGYDIWPLGFTVVPPYLASTDRAAYNDRFFHRSITYLLGNGTGSDSALNLTDCSATLLGSTRYRRGEHMFRYMELVYPGVHQHAKVIAQGISHDGSEIYQSPEFRALLVELVN